MTTRPSEVSVEAFAAATPSVPADRIECEDCGTEYIGDPEDKRCPICPGDDTEGQQ